jgi:hypothetical protein
MAVSSGQKKLAADFLTNIGVAWFAAGVIGLFVGEARDLNNLLTSLSWGIGFSILFFMVGWRFMKGVRL